MYHYLRTHDRKRIAVVEPWICDESSYKFSSGVAIRNLLDFYDTLPPEKRDGYKSDFNEIKLMYEWFFEKFLPNELGGVVSEENLNKTHDEVRSRLLKVAERYGLVYGVD